MMFEKLILHVRTALLAFVLSLSMVATATAEGTSQTGQTTQTDNVSDIFGSTDYTQTTLDSFDQILIGMTSYVKQMYGYTYPVGIKLFFLLSVISLVWFGFQIAMSDGVVSGVMREIVLTVFGIVISYSFIDPYGYSLLIGNISDPFSSSDSGGIIGGFNWLSDRAMPGSMDNSASTVTSVMASFMHSMQSVQVSLWEGLSGLGVVNILLNATTTAIMFLLVTLILSFVSMLAGVAMLMTHINISIALIVGPVCIPWIVFSKTRWIFDGWIKFVAIAGLSKLVAALVLGIASLSMTNILTHMSSNGSMTGLMGTALSVAMLGLLCAGMMLKSTSIAQSILSGGGSGGGRIGNIKNQLFG